MMSSVPRILDLALSFLHRCRLCHKLQPWYRLVMCGPLETFAYVWESVFFY